MKYLESLNEKQKEAVLSIDGPLLIIAGAGAGKTKTITHRIAYMIHQGIAPENILAITFTNKAAKEMRDRTRAMLKNENVGKMPHISTFHSFGISVIRENAGKIGYTQRFNVLDEGDSVSMIKDILTADGYDTKQYDPKKIKGLISRAKNKMFVPSDLKEGNANQIEKLTGNVWEKYSIQCKKENSLDFDDLLIEPVKLLRNNPEIRKFYQDKYKYIHIDEYQDTNEVQYELSKLLVSETRNICVVGDGDQNIYSWRGANLRNILNFEKDYPGAKSVLLEENYRSTSTILAVANDIIQKNTVRKEKNLFTKNVSGEKVKTYSGFDEREEAFFVAKECAVLIDKGTSPEEIAVLYRSNFQSRILEEAFLSIGLSYQVLGTKFFDRKEIKDILSYIKSSENPQSFSDIKRVINTPARGIGKVTLSKIFAGQSELLPPKTKIVLNNFYKLLEEIKTIIETLNPSDAIKMIIEKTGIKKELMEGSDEDKERLENLFELVTVAQGYDQFGTEGMFKLLDDAMLQSEQDNIDETQKAVRLMTIHGSKGLEFDVVFIVGLEQDLLPHSKMNKNMNKEEEEEERRLMYVAVTRAKKILYLTNAEIRTIYGNKKIQVPSEFLYDIKNENTEKIFREKQAKKQYGGFNRNIDDSDGWMGKTIYLD